MSESPTVVESAQSDPPESARVIDIGMVLTTPKGDRLLITDILNSRIRVVRIPVGCDASDYPARFRPRPTPTDPTAATMR